MTATSKRAVSKMSEIFLRRVSRSLVSGLGGFNGGWRFRFGQS
jgi:hypothetical protein